MTLRLPHYEVKCVQRRCFQCGSVPLRSDIKGTKLPPGKLVYDFLFVIIELFSLAFTVEVLQGKMCQDSLLSGGGRSLGAKISGGRGRPWGIFFWFLQN